MKHTSRQRDPIVLTNGSYAIGMSNAVIFFMDTPNDHIFQSSSYHLQEENESLIV